MLLIFSHTILFLDGMKTIMVQSGSCKRSTVKLDTSNLCLYERIIDVYEDNDLRVEGVQFILIINLLTVILLKWVITG